MRILLIGASGPLGAEVAKVSIDQGHEVTAIVRHPEASQKNLGKANIVKGDILNPADVNRAFANVDAVISVLGTREVRKITTVVSEGTRNIVVAMNSFGIKRIVCVTGIGAGDSKGHGGFFYDRIINPLLLKEIYEDKDRQEKLIRESSLEWTLVRPAVLTNGKALGQFRTITNMSGVTTTKISRADTALFLLEETITPKFLQKTVALSY